VIAEVQVLQYATLDGDQLTFEVELTNNNLHTIKLRYMRFADSDQSDLYVTTNTASAGGVESKMQGKGGTLFMRDLAGKVTVRTAPYNKEVDLVRHSRWARRSRAITSCSSCFGLRRWRQLRLPMSFKLALQ